MSNSIRNQTGCPHVVGEISYTIVGIPGSKIHRHYESTHTDLVTAESTPTENIMDIYVPLLAYLNDRHKLPSDVLPGFEEFVAIVHSAHVVVDWFSPNFLCPICNEQLLPEIVSKFQNEIEEVTK